MTERVVKVIDWLWTHQVKAFLGMFYIVMIVTMVESCND